MINKFTTLNYDITLKNIIKSIKEEFQSPYEQERLLKEYGATIEYDYDNWGNKDGMNTEETVFAMNDDIIKKIVNDYEISPNVGNLYKEYPKACESNDNLK